MTVGFADTEAAPSSELVLAKGHVLVSGVPEGLDALFISELVQKAEQTPLLLHICRDDQRLALMSGGVKFFAPHVRVLEFPAWDTVPYDRSSPNPAITSRRIATLTRLVLARKDQPTIVLTTMNAALQRLPSRDFIKLAALKLRTGAIVPMDKVIAHLVQNGFQRSETVMDPGEYAVRGGILDLFPPGHGKPMRLDFFGDTLESIRRFDPDTQRTTGQSTNLVLLSMSEIPCGEKDIRKFRQRYVELFGTVTEHDPLYEAVSSGSRYQGMEHWLPLFHEKLATIFDYLPEGFICLDPLSENARQQRLEQIDDHYQARLEAQEQKAFGAPPYKPVPREHLFLGEEDWNTLLQSRSVRSLTSFEVPSDVQNVPSFSLNGRGGRKFVTERKDSSTNVFEAVSAHIRQCLNDKKRVVIACWSRGSRERLMSLLGEHQLSGGVKVENWSDVLKLPANAIGFAIFGLESGFVSEKTVILSEQDILGDRLTRPRQRSAKASDVLFEVSTLNIGDLVVHAEHGIGRFSGLKTIEAAGAPHDCLELVYHGDDRLYLPVENIELLSRFGPEDSGIPLDRLGGVAWQNRKAKLKKRVRDMAEKLIAVAAQRELNSATPMQPPEGIYEEFCARFPFEETEDQKTAINSVIEDLARGRPMDRLICGDVGFGKTEVALRSAMIAVMAGYQVAIVVPTTLLARQHYATFAERFRGFPVRIAQASRLVSARDLTAAKDGVASGEIDIIVGTHALLGKTVRFAHLGLLIIDEEQHFGVQHKERLKTFREDVHVLTLTATPIPRTLQLALTGVRELSLITTPPLDRLAVRTFILPFDAVVIREALLRERFRGGQSFYVCPRISDLDEAGQFLAEYVPELRVARAHGQMPPAQLDDVMNAFYEQKFDVLLSTTIVESGLDIPTANTLIVHRADIFGLAQLYQLRGRIGRSKTRAYAHFTIPVNAKLTVAAEKRLKVLQSLDTLGAGFSLASHDLDIRGAGNLLGEEQSGHIREVGYELYQSMLEEAIASLKGGEGSPVEDQWSPQISLGTAVLIPEAYVPDLQLRLGLYRRLSRITDNQEIEAFGAELVDRFGEMPEEVGHLLNIVRIKTLCRRAGIQQIETGPKGAVITFRNNAFSNPTALIT
ncbi:MAG: transcription-repair coupling factor, partial [Methyloligellaceae bacterium]